MSAPTIPSASSTAFVDQLDLAAAGFTRVAPKATGRPGYAPGDLLKLYIYGYLNRVRSSRRLEAECYRNIEVYLAVAALEAGLQDRRRFQERQSRRVQKGFPGVRDPVPAA